MDIWTNWLDMESEGVFFLDSATIRITIPTVPSLLCNIVNLTLIHIQWRSFSGPYFCWNVCVLITLVITLHYIWSETQILWVFVNSHKRLKMTIKHFPKMSMTSIVDVILTLGKCLIVIFSFQKAFNHLSAFGHITCTIIIVRTYRNNTVNNWADT